MHDSSPSTPGDLPNDAASADVPLLRDDQTGHSAADGLKWMKSLGSESNQFIFRGQSRIYESVLPTLLRPNISNDERNAWWAVMGRFVSDRNGLAGYIVPSPHDAVAILQHYLIKSPVIDVTGTPEIALYFALTNPSPEPTRILYAIEVEAVKAAGYVVTDHAFLALPFEDGGDKHRWLRQDGLTIGCPDWTNLNCARGLDFARLNGLKRFTFRMRVGDEKLVAEFGDLESIEGDPLAAKVRGMFESIAHHRGLLKTVQPLMPYGTTIDAHGLLLAEIDSLIASARELPLSPADINQIEQLRGAATSYIWDTSWKAALSFWKAKYEKAASESQR